MKDEIKEMIKQELGFGETNQNDNTKYLNSTLKNKKKALLFIHVMSELSSIKEIMLVTIERKNPKIETGTIRAYLKSLERQTELIHFKKKPYSTDNNLTRRKNRHGNKPKYPKRIYVCPNKSQKYDDFLKELEEKIIQQGGTKNGRKQ